MGVENARRSGSTFCGSAVNRSGSGARKYGARLLPHSRLAPAGSEPVRNEDRTLAAAVKFLSFHAGFNTSRTRSISSSLL
jgi:hypothetical protein